MKWLNITQSASRLGVTRQCLASAIARGEFPAVRVGKATRIAEGYVDALVERAAATEDEGTGYGHDVGTT